MLRYLSQPIVMVGPLGVGKSTIIHRLEEIYPGKFGFSCLHSTRQPRAGEHDGVDYHYVSHEVFEDMISKGMFIEHTEVHGNLYGTSFQAVKDVEKTGKICIPDLNIDGALALSKSRMRLFIVLVTPQSLQILEARPRGRKTDTEQQIQTRLEAARKEMKRLEENKQLFNLVLINDNLDNSVVKLQMELFKRYNLV